MRRRAAWGIVLLLIVQCPVHVYLIAHPEALPAIPVWVLAARPPFQIVLIVWALGHARSSPAYAAPAPERR